MDSIFDWKDFNKIIKLVIHPFLPLCFMARYNGTIECFDFETRTLLFKLNGHRNDDPINCIRIDSSGKKIISCSNMTICYWDLENPINNRILNNPGSQFRNVIWDYSGTLFTVCSNYEPLQVIKPSNLESLVKQKGPSGTVINEFTIGLTSHPYLPMYASCHSSTIPKIKIQNWNSNETICELHLVESSLKFAFSSELIRELVCNDKYIISLSDDSTNNIWIRIWKWPDFTLETHPKIYYGCVKTIKTTNSHKINLINNKLFYHQNNNIHILDISDIDPNNWTTKSIECELYQHGYFTIRTNDWQVFQTPEKTIKLIIHENFCFRPIKIINL